MACDLEVDTDRMRKASALLVLAAECDGIVERRYGCLSAAGRADGPPGFREAARLAIVRADQCVAAASALASHAGRLADFLRTAADSFDRAEQLCAAGG
jgi:hypothetical protein